MPLVVAVKQALGWELIRQAPRVAAGSSGATWPGVSSARLISRRALVDAGAAATVDKRTLLRSIWEERGLKYTTQQAGEALAQMPPLGSSQGESTPPSILYSAVQGADRLLPRGWLPGARHAGVRNPEPPAADCGAGRHGGLPTGARGAPCTSRPSAISFMAVPLSQTQAKWLVSQGADATGLPPDFLPQEAAGFRVS